MVRTVEREERDEKKVIGFEEFKKLVNSPEWERSQEVENMDRFPIERWRAILDGYVDIPHFEKLVRSDGWERDQRVDGVGVKFNNLGNIEIIYTEEWSYDKNNPDSFTTTPTHLFVKGIRVMLEDGNKATTSDLVDVLPKEFTTIDYSKLNI